MRPPSYIGAFILIGLGIAFLLVNLGIAPSIGAILSRWWPLILIAVGASMLVRGRRG